MSATHAGDAAGGRAVRAAARSAGSVAALVALAVLWVASALFAGVPFPPAALADAIVRATPGDVATFLIERLGQLASALLLAGALGGSVALGAEALARTATRGRPRPVVAGGVLAAVALAASLAGPSDDVGIGGVAAALASAWAAYALVAGRALDVLARGADDGRRRALRLGAGAAAGVALAGGALGWVVRRLGGPDTNVPIAAPATPARVPARAPFPDVPGLSPEVTSVADHYVVDVSFVPPSIEAAEWTLRVFGDVDRPLELSFAELQRGFDVVEDFSVLTCISNEVGGDLVGHSAWRGVRVADVLERAGVRRGAVDVVFRSGDGYSDSIPVEVARNPSVLLAFGQNGRALTQEHGFPCRVRIPPIYGMKNVKWLESVEVVATDHSGYWQRRGWSDDAVVHTSCRIDAVGDGRSARAGDATWIAGVAWAGDRGVDAVEVSTDGGRTWERAQLKEPVAAASWRVWAYRWTPPSAGRAEVVCRAVDGRGERQTAAVAPPHPDGATGYHRVEVDVA